MHSAQILKENYRYIFNQWEGLEENKKKVLIVEDSRIFANAVKKKIESQLSFSCEILSSFEETVRILESNGPDFFVAILDLNLPDAPNGEVVDYVISKKIPVIILTATFNDDLRDRILSKNVVDYIIKEGPQTLSHLAKIITRLYKNHATKILVVDDSGVSRLCIKKLLEMQKYIVIEAKNGKEALDQLEAHPDTKLVITDYQMPKMDGFELTSEIRRKHPMDELAVIGISGHGNTILSAKFLKKGANDFVAKPFGNEEFFWRINQNIEMLEYIESIKSAAIKDYLTGLYNRRYLIDVGRTLFKNAQRESLQLSIAMLDIDHFKKVNDEYGHMSGDKVLQHLALMMKKHFRQSDVISRFGGEEFCIMAVNLKAENALNHFEKLRKDIELQEIQTDSGLVRVTVSIGVTSEIEKNLEHTIKRADSLLYKAKQTGRNTVICA
jgi:diguanylate cyclase (GGDEF)-like protein